MKTRYRAVEYMYDPDRDVWKRTSYEGQVYDTLEKAQARVKEMRRITDNLTGSQYGEENYMHYILRESVADKIDKIVAEAGFISSDRELASNILKKFVDLGKVTIND